MPRTLLFFASAILFAFSLQAERLYLHGKVVMADGTPPGRPVIIQRHCAGMDHALTEATASPKTGDYFIQLDVNDFGQVFSGGLTGMGIFGCYLRASAKGTISSQVDLTERNAIRGLQIPAIVLTPATAGSHLDLGSEQSVPHGVLKQWSAALKEINGKNWVAAETQLRPIVAAAPKFAGAWLALGLSCYQQNKPAEARTALQREIELDPKRLQAYTMLADSQIELGDWAAAIKTSETLMAADPRHTYLEAYLEDAIARYQSKDLDGALARINQAIRYDKPKDYPRAEYILGVILEARHELDAAAVHLRDYIQRNPNTSDIAAVKERLANLGKAPPADLRAEMSAPDMRLPAAGEAPVPGGYKAFAAMAAMKTTPGYDNFFLEYCRAITEFGPAKPSPTMETRTLVLNFISSVAALEELGRRDGDRTVVRLEWDSDAKRQNAARVLTLLGWRLSQTGGNFELAPGDQPVDGYRQRIPALFGIDELAVRDALAAKRPFEFSIPAENARLIGGPAWGIVVKGPSTSAGTPIELFARDTRFALVYAALGSMNTETAGAVVSAIGLGSILLHNSAPLFLYGDAISVGASGVAVPGGAAADPIWTRLAGHDPHNPSKFLRALFEKDQGRLLLFYYDVAHADAAHRQFVLASADRAEAFYKWYRDSMAPAVPSDAAERWQSTILQKLPMDAAGNVQYPGGRGAWTTSNAAGPEALLSIPNLPVFAAVLDLQARRGAPFDPESARLLVQHYTEWRSLTPYFEKLPALGGAEFQALDAFSAAAATAGAQTQNVLLGEWQSLVALDVLASQAGTFDSARAARFFRQICDGLRPDGQPSAALAVLRDMTGGAENLDDAVPSRLLRLNGQHRAAWDRTKELQHVPPLGSLGASPPPAQALAALSGLVYAAHLQPNYLLVAEDPQLLAKHAFVPPAAKRATLFADTGLVISSSHPGSYFAGGFGRFSDLSRELDRRTVDEAPSTNDEGSPGPASPESAAQDNASPSIDRPAPPPEALFHTTGRLVEVYATVTDNRGRYVDDLNAADFTILEDGQHRPAFAFENHNDSVSVALLFDTTGSMEGTLPSLKAAALHLIEELRPSDTVAVYGFNDRIAQLQSFTSDKTAAQRAVLRAHASGVTALYDALVRVNRDLAQRSGKKVIIVFTDGEDNASMLTGDTAILRAKSSGIPIYTIAEGDALQHTALLDQLSNISRSTGGASFLIRKLEDIAAVFQKVSDDLMHGYLLAFQPAPAENRTWRTIQVVLSNAKSRKVRAREGFYPEE